MFTFVGATFNNGQNADIAIDHLSHMGVHMIEHCDAIALRWYGTRSCCEVLFIEINNKMKT